MEDAWSETGMGTVALTGAGVPERLRRQLPLPPPPPVPLAAAPLVAASLAAAGDAAPPVWAEAGGPPA